MGTPRHTLGYTHAVTHQLTYPPLDEYRLLLSSRRQKIHQRWRYLRKVGMSGTEDVLFYLSHAPRGISPRHEFYLLRLFGEDI